MDEKWPKLAANGRVSLVEGLTAVISVLVENTRGMPDPAVMWRAL